MNNKKNILFVEYCPDLKGGGAQRVFLNILNTLNKAEYKIFAAFPMHKGGDLAEEIPEHVTSINYDSKSPDKTGNKIFAYIKFILFIPIIVFQNCIRLKRNDIQVVYCHSIISGFHFSLAKYFVNFKLIYHEHNMASQRPKMIIWRYMFNFVSDRSDKIIAISRGVANELVDYGSDEEKVLVVHNGIELQLTDNVDQLKVRGCQRLGIPSGEKPLLAGMIGHFRPWKGQSLFVESYEVASQLDNDIHYVIVGGIHDNVYYEQVKQYILQHDLSDKITITGHQDDIPELLACMDLLVVPSVPEPFGLVVLEAMMMEKPVVAFNIGGPAEIIKSGQTGVLVDNVDSASLGQGIGSLISDPELRRVMGGKGRSLLEQAFTCQVQVGKIEVIINDLYDELSTLK